MYRKDDVIYIVYFGDCGTYGLMTCVEIDESRRLIARHLNQRVHPSVDNVLTSGAYLPSTASQVVFRNLRGPE